MKNVLILTVSIILIGCGNHTPKIKNTEKQQDYSLSEQNNHKNDKYVTLKSLRTLKDTTILIKTYDSILENDSHLNSKKEIIKNITSSFINEFDISNMMLDSLFGAFGINYQRINLIIKIIKKSESSEKYLVEGCTVMKNKEVPYKGEIVIKNVLKSNLNPYNFSDSANYIIKIKSVYHFVEDKTIAGAGVFGGNLDFTLVIDNDNKLHNNLWEWWGDGYSNFQFQGNWISSNGTEYQCIFGSGRLEKSGDLDVGDGSFVPNKKYYKYGWADYSKQF